MHSCRACTLESLTHEFKGFAIPPLLVFVIQFSSSSLYFFKMCNKHSEYVA